MIDNVHYIQTHCTMTSRYTVIYFTTQKHTTLVMIQLKTSSEVIRTSHRRHNTLSPSRQYSQLWTTAPYSKKAKRKRKWHNILF